MKIIKKGRKYYNKKEHDVVDTLCLIILAVTTIIFILVRILI